MDNDDTMFAFQERLCSMIEIEVIHQGGTPKQILPSRLNAMLHLPLLGHHSPQLMTCPRKVTNKSHSPSGLERSNRLRRAHAGGVRISSDG
jgi:hypothetical protein